MAKEATTKPQRKGRKVSREQAKRLLCLALAAIMLISLLTVAFSSIGMAPTVVAG